MAQPQIVSAVVSQDGTKYTVTYDQKMIAPYTSQFFFRYSFTNNGSNDYRQRLYYVLNPKVLTEGVDTFVFLTDLGLDNRPTSLPIPINLHPSISTQFTTTFQSTDIANEQGEGPVNVTNLQLDTSGTPDTYLPSNYEYLDAFFKKERPQASKDKIFCLYNTATVEGVNDEDIIDAYFDEYGITNHIKYGVDFSDFNNVGYNWWQNWGQAVHDIIVENQIEQVCCGPTCEYRIVVASTATGEDAWQNWADCSTALGGIKVIKAELDRRQSNTTQSITSVGYCYDISSVTESDGDSRQDVAEDYTKGFDNCKYSTRF